MGKKPMEGPIMGVPFFEITFFHAARGSSEGITLQASISGRSGAVRYHWGSPYGILSPDQVKDLTNQLNVIVLAALAEWTGVEGVLPME